MKDLKTAQTSYADAGVNIEHGNRLVDRIKPLVKGTHRNGVMGGIGGFGGLFDLSTTNYKQPVLVSGTDGVGTKLKLAIDTGRHDTIGIDLVAMCVNDLLVLGAEPLFFLDYYASGTLDVDTAETIIGGIVKGCTMAGCALIGGETAEMPGMYHGQDYDLAGFCVGIVEKDRIIDGSGIVAGDTVIAVASSGAHSNGYSLIRKLISDSNTSLDSIVDGRPLMDLLLEPTRIYVKPVLDLLTMTDVKGIAHITGGGLMENLPRILPDDIALEIDTASWQWPGLFGWLQSAGSIIDREMYTVFNCGIGLVLVVDDPYADSVIEHLNARGENAWKLGRAVQRSGDGAPVILS